MSEGLVLTYPDEGTRQEARRRGFKTVIADEPMTIFDKTLVVGPGTDVPWDLLDAGWHFLERWDVAAPLWRYGILAADIGTPEERERTEALTIDLRVLVYAPELLLIRRSKDADALLCAWQEECVEGGDSRLAFLRALCRVKPLFLALPRCWLVERASVSGGAR